MGRARARRLGALAPFAALVATLVVASGCSRKQDPPRTLVDGSLARPTPALDDVDGPTVAARVVARRIDAVAPGSRIASCLHDGWSERPTGVVVLRIGVLGASLTFESPAGRSVQACDGTLTHNTGGPWCGHSYGRLYDGRLRDLHLGLGGCRDAEGRPVAFAWIEPGAGTRYVVVEQRGYSEVYATSGSLPVRVSTADGIDLEQLGATFDVSEHSADGRKLSAYVLEARVAG